MESHCLNELPVLGLWQDAIREGNKQTDRSWNREGCGKHSASMLFHGHAVCIISHWARGPWESPALSCGLLRHNSRRLLKGFVLNRNIGGKWGLITKWRSGMYKWINVFLTMLDYCWKKKREKKASKLGRNKSTAFCNYRSFWVSLSPPLSFLYLPLLLPK